MTSFLSHDLTFAEPAPMGFARCRTCGGYVTGEQWASEPCPGRRDEKVD